MASSVSIEKSGLNQKWIKASIAGSMWAASEIVIGSFLHNLRVPFSGSILTAIGVILLISISYRWNEKGLFWRAGLICALMKTLSPSAVIFGPMIAILSEALLVEAAVRLTGKNPAGFILGAVLAMSWNLVQRILTLVIFYGMSIIEVYTDLAAMAGRQTGIEADMIWLPIIIILTLDIITGIITALAGIRLGRKLASATPLKKAGTTGKSSLNRFNDPEKRNQYSLFWLILNIIFLAGSMLVLNNSRIVVWMSVVIIVVMIWITRYKRAMRQLLNPKFWVFFLLITLVTSFVFIRVREGENSLAMGLTEALRMNFRAAVVILGFAAVGTELYNPVIREYFKGSRLRNLPPALELAAESLPAFIAGIPSFREIIRNPASSLLSVTSLAEARLNDVRVHNQSGIYIVTGKVNEGKTSFVKQLTEILENNNYKVGGIFTERVIQNGELTGYDLYDIADGSRIKFLRTTSATGPDKIGRYYIYPPALAKGKEILLNSRYNNITVIDEVGRLELNEGGWADSLPCLLEEDEKIIVLTVRKEFVQEVINKWKIRKSRVLNISEISPQEAFNIIIPPFS